MPKFPDGINAFLSVRMPVMRIRKMRVAVRDRQVAMPVHMLASNGGCLLVVMLVVDIIGPMHMGVAVFQRCVVVRVPVVFGQMQCYSHRHQNSGRQPLKGDGFTQQANREQRAKKRRNGKVGAGAGRAKVAQANDKQRKTCAVTDKTQQACSQGNGNGWPVRATVQGQNQRQIGRASSQSFDHGNPGGIAKGHLACQIVVDGPGKTGTQYCQGRP